MMIIIFIIVIIIMIVIIIAMIIMSLKHGSSSKDDVNEMSLEGIHTKYFLTFWISQIRYLLLIIFLLNIGFNLNTFILSVSSIRVNAFKTDDKSEIR